MYGYAWQSPAMLTDPLGLDSCGFLKLGCLFRGVDWESMLLIGSDMLALGLTAYGFGFTLLPFVVGEGFLMTGVEAAFPWLAAGAFTSMTGAAETFALGGSNADRGVVFSTNVIGLLPNPVFAVGGDVLQLGWDLYHSIRHGGGTCPAQECGP